MKKDDKNIVDVLKDMGKLQIIGIQSPEATPTAKKQSMKAYVKQAKAKQNKSETGILDKLAKTTIDSKIIEYLAIKEQVKQLEKRKSILEGELDSNALNNEGHVLLGQNYEYKIDTQTYDMVISKADALKAGVWAEFVKRGFTKAASRKLRKVREL
jgi:hypothetical protein